MVHREEEFTKGEALKIKEATLQLIKKRGMFRMSPEALDLRVERHFSKSVVDVLAQWSIFGSRGQRTISVEIEEHESRFELLKDALLPEFAKKWWPVRKRKSHKKVTLLAEVLFPDIPVGKGALSNSVLKIAYVDGEKYEV